MARKEITVTIDAEGRDRGKQFIIREMSAMKAEKWAARAMLALMRSGIEVPQDVAEAGLSGIAAMGLRALAGIHFEEAEPLMAEMMACVEYIPDRSRPMVKRPLVEDDIEEVLTILRLREEVLSLHVGFSIAEYRSRRTPVPAMTAIDDSLNTGTSLVQ